MNKIKDVDDFCDVAGFYRHDSTLLIDDDDWEFEDYFFDPDAAQKFMSLHPNVQIWTLLSGDDGDYLESGVHYVNRTGYMFTDIKATDSRLDGFRNEDGSVTLPWFVNEPLEAVNA